MSRRAHESRIGRDERGVESFRERDVGRVEDGQVLLESPDPCQQRQDWISRDRHLAEIVERLLAAAIDELAQVNQPAERLHDFGIQKVGGVERLGGG